MGRIRLGKSGSLQIDFQYMGTRCREQTALPDTAANRKTLEKLIQKIEAEILLGTFVYSNYFPNSKMVARFEKQQQRLLAGNRAERLPTFEEFAVIWLDEMQVSWRDPQAVQLPVNRAYGQQDTSCSSSAFAAYLEALGGLIGKSS